MTFGKLMGISFAIVGGILVVTIVAVVIGASLS
jgi:hypothetical protein